MEELIGKTLNRYQIIELLGEGGMGAVYRGHDVTLQRDVAIKVMHTHLSRKSDFQERFLQEARTAARLNHPSIVAVYDFGQAQGMLYIVMEFIPGNNLRGMIHQLRVKKQWFPLDEAIGLISHITSAVGYAHDNGILHRDIKPANIMLQPTPANGLPYRPILTDLGLAKLIEASGLTQEGTAIGTPPYMSPEQTLGEKTDSRADVYSLGILLYELAVGQLPFPIKTLTDAIRYHNQEIPPPPSTFVPDFPPALETVILKAIAKSPTDRYIDAAVFGQALEQLSTTGSLTHIPKTSLTEQVSLLTLLISEDPAVPGRPDFPDPSQISNSSLGRIQVLTQDETAYTVEIPAEGLSIGRAETNILTLEDPKVSRQHAWIEFDGQNYRVTDLNSANGTLLGAQKLLPGNPEIWMPDVALGIGSHWLRLLASDAIGTTGLIASDGSLVEPGRVTTSTGEGWISVFLEQHAVTTSPGKSGQFSLKMLNQGPLVDHLRVTIQGVPDNWIHVAPVEIQLLPGSQDQVKVFITPPG